jgi:hypothetical protein
VAWEGEGARVLLLSFDTFMEVKEMKPENPDEIYDGLESDASLDDYEPGPFECDVCRELFAQDATHMCNMCNETVCDGCWPKHYDAHEEK